MNERASKPSISEDDVLGVAADLLLLEKGRRAVGRYRDAAVILLRQQPGTPLSPSILNPAVSGGAASALKQRAYRLRLDLEYLLPEGFLQNRGHMGASRLFVELTPSMRSRLESLASDPKPLIDGVLNRLGGWRSAPNFEWPVTVAILGTQFNLREWLGNLEGEDENEDEDSDDGGNKKKKGGTPSLDREGSHNWGIAELAAREAASKLRTLQLALSSPQHPLNQLMPRTSIMRLPPSQERIHGIVALKQLNTPAVIADPARRADLETVIHSLDISPLFIGEPGKPLETIIVACVTADIPRKIQIRAFRVPPTDLIPFAA